jgi:hypothetical protein
MKTWEQVHLVSTGHAAEVQMFRLHYRMFRSSMRPLGAPICYTPAIKAAVVPLRLASIKRETLKSPHFVIRCNVGLE